MDKTELLDFIKSLPDDVQMHPINLSESTQHCNEWESQHQLTPYRSGLYHNSVDNLLTIKLSFTTKYEGEFKRTYEDPDGTFNNIRRIN